MRLLDELAAAVGTLTIVPAATPPSPALRVASLASFPLVGLLLGMAAAATTALVGGWSPTLAAVTGVGLLTVVSGGSVSGALAPRLGVLGWAARAIAVGCKIWSAVALPPSAFVLPPMLSRWAIVVQCYGGRAAPGDDPASAVVGRAGFREFGWASVLGIGLPLAATEAVGLVLVLAVALTTVATRMIGYRHTPRSATWLVAVTAELTEVVAFVTLGTLARTAG